MAAVIEASHRQVCAVCGNFGMVLLLIPETKIEAVTECFHCGPPSVPIVNMESK